MPDRTVYLETFGCQMNELDSELVAGALTALGYRFVPRLEGADVVLFNTCSVRERAEQKVWSRLGALKERKSENPGMVVGVLGCMAERDGIDLIRRMPVVDVLCGPGELDKLPALLDNAVRTRASLLGEEGAAELAAARSARAVALQGNTSRRSGTLSAAADSLELLDLNRAISPSGGAGKSSAYVRITRGCNKFCTYCVVPFTRGAEIHRPPEHIIDECKRLADSGVIEVTLLGQTVNHYRYEDAVAVSLNGVRQPQKGRTYKGSHNRDALSGRAGVTTFADLLRRIHDEVPAIQRLRFVTSYPRDFGDDVLEVIRDHPRICRYIHVPAQTGSNSQLRAMNRGYTVEQYLEFIDRCRHYLDQPEIGRPLMLSGDVIVGFPGETDEDFGATVALLERARYKNCFIFKYSPRPGTVAFDKLPDDVPEHVKRKRNNHLLAVQARISDEISREQVGREFDVLVEGLSRREHKKRGTDVKPGSGMVSITIGGSKLAPVSGGENGGNGAACSPDGSAVLTPEAGGPVQLSGRTDTDLIVFFNAPQGTPPDDLVGKVMRCRITGASNLALEGELVA